MSPHQIYYCEVRGENQPLERGHWFFHPGQWAVCGSASRERNGKWLLHIHFPKAGKALPETAALFPTLAAAKQFVADYFEAAVVRVPPARMPKPEDL